MSGRFDTVYERRNTGCFKWDSHGGPDDTIPMTVADMDFPIDEAISEAVAKRNSHPIYGYSAIPHSYFESFINWMDRRFKAAYEREWIDAIPGVLSGLALSIQVLTEPGDKVVVQPPVYQPFPIMVERNERIVEENRLVRSGMEFTIDFQDLENRLISGASAIMLCSPHNPVGRVWKREELVRVLDIAKRYDAVVLSDEIHQDLIMPGYEQLPLIEVWMDSGGKADECPVVAVTSATKSFNLAGLNSAYLIAPATKYRRRIQDAVGRCFMGMVNTLSVEAAIAGYEYGEPWLDEVMGYLYENYRLVDRLFKENGAVVPVAPIEGTYLLWLDFRKYAGDDAIGDALKNARVQLNDGASYGSAGFKRMNLAAPASVVAEATRRTIEALARTDPQS